jgi:hypothetical protein
VNNRYNDEGSGEDDSGTNNWHLGETLLVNNYEFTRKRLNKPKNGSLP